MEDITPEPTPDTINAIVQAITQAQSQDTEVRKQGELFVEGEERKRGYLKLLARVIQNEFHAAAVRMIAALLLRNTLKAFANGDPVAPTLGHSDINDVSECIPMILPSVPPALLEPLTDSLNFIPKARERLPPLPAGGKRPPIGLPSMLGGGGMPPHKKMAGNKQSMAQGGGVGAGFGRGGGGGGLSVGSFRTGLPIAAGSLPIGPSIPLNGEIVKKAMEVSKSAWTNDLADWDGRSICSLYPDMSFPAGIVCLTPNERSVCHYCMQKIFQAEVRLGIQQKIAENGVALIQWFHVGCVPRVSGMSSAQSIVNIDKAPPPVRALLMSLLQPDPVEGQGGVGLTASG